MSGKSNMAIISDFMAFSAQHISIVVLLLVIIHFTRNYLTPGVCAVPGPFLAKISNIWRFFDVANGSAEATLYKLHRKHRDYVRLGPNVVSVWSLDALKIIYGINKGYTKVSTADQVSSINIDMFLDRLLQSSTAVIQGKTSIYPLHGYR